MNEWIMNLARGEFEYKNQRLVLPEAPLMVHVEAGKTADGNFTLRNEEGNPIKGTIRCTDANMHLSQNFIIGKEFIVSFTYSACHLTVGEHVKGSIWITSNYGEYELPYLVNVEAPSFETTLGKVKDLNQFANLAKDYPEEALRIFKSKDFETVFLYRDTINAMLYKSLLKGAFTSQAMEEFLIATHKKVRIQLDASKQHFEYKDLERKFMDKVVLHKNTWGFTEIRIHSDAEFLIPEHKVLWTDKFIGNTFSLEFIVDPEKMHKGNNYGKITIETVRQRITVEVAASLKKKEAVKGSICKRRMGKYRLTSNYLDFRMDKVKREDYIYQMEELLKSYGEALDDYIVAMIRAHMAVIDKKEAIAFAYLREKEEKFSKPWPETPDNVLEYAGTLYLKALLTKEERDVANAGKEISRYYENAFYDWRLLWFLLYIDRRYDHQGVRLEAILNHLKEGCLSPVLYYEAFQIFNQHPELLKELNSETIAVMRWGIAKGLCNEELALRYTYQAGRMKRFIPMVFHGLELVYGQFPKKDMLHAICSMLIRGEKRDGKYFKWFRMGVEQQLRITDIYEYFMYTMDVESETELPQPLLLYFMYDNHLNDKKKALLYARIIKDKVKNPIMYNNYIMGMEKFLRKQLKERNISNNLAILYEDLITRDKLDVELAKSLPDVMFRYEVVCMNPNMVGVCVVHKEVEEESFVPFVKGKAQVGIYTENVKILLVDKKDNRYVETMDYTINKLLHMEDLTIPCYELAGGNSKLRLYVFAKTESHYPINKDNVGIYKDALDHLPLRKTYRKKNYNALIQYCYDNAEGELLRELLEDLDISMAEPKERVKWVELLMVKEMYPKAVEYVKQYGYEGIDLYRLGKLCSYMVLSSEGEQNKDLLKLCHYLFVQVQYSEPILECLIADFTGTNKEMLDIWKVSEGFRINRKPLEERLLAQILFTGNLVKEGIPVYESYADQGENRQLKKAFLSYVAYLSLIQNVELPDSIYERMKKSVIYEENKACMLSLLKHYSTMHELDDKEKEFVDYNLSKLIEEGYLFQFFQDFDGLISLPSKLCNVCVVEYIGDPKVPVTIRYRIEGEGKGYEEKMRNAYNGIFVRDFVLFRDEVLSYQILVQKNGEFHEVKKGTLKPSVKKKERVENNFTILNDILTAKEEKEMDHLMESMERYLKRQYLMERLFEPI